MDDDADYDQARGSSERGRSPRKLRRSFSRTRPLASGVRQQRLCGEGIGTATFDPSAVLPYHKHTFTETITILGGVAQVAVEGRSYHLTPFDCISVPAGVAHEVTNCSKDSSLLALWAFASAAPSRELIDQKFVIQDRNLSNPTLFDPESVVRFNDAGTYDLSAGAEFRDLFAGRLGAVGICGGYGRFQPAASLPCHIHKCDESITIVEGEAACLVQVNQYSLSDCDTAFIANMENRGSV